MSKKRIILSSLSVSPKRMEQAYVKELNILGRQLLNEIKTYILPILQWNESKLKIQLDSLPDQLAAMFVLINQNFRGKITAGLATSLATGAINNISELNAQRFNKAIPHKLRGVNLIKIIQNEKLNDFIKVSIAQNAQLISSIPEQYLSQVQSTIYSSYLAGERYDVIAQKLMSRTNSVGSKLKNRIKTIARFETKKIHSQLTMLRSTTLGITKAYYMSSRDERVRKSHRELDGKEYEIMKGAWSKTAQKFIIPGVTDINCRCSYKPILELD